MKMSLVSFGIQLYPAVDVQAGINFRQVHRDTGRRVRRMNVVGEEQEPVENSEIAKGYEVSKGRYLIVEPDEIAKLRIESKRVLDISHFIDPRELPLALFERPYFVVPQAKESPEAFAVVREAMQETGKAAIGEITFGGREHLVLVSVPSDPSERGLMAYILRYVAELRKSGEYFSGIPRIEVDKKQLSMAGELIRAYSAPVNLEQFTDDYEAALQELIEAKQKDQPLPLEEEVPGPSKVIDLMEALRKSVAEAGGSPSGGKTARGASGKGGESRGSGASGRSGSGQLGSGQSGSGQSGSGQSGDKGPSLVKPGRRRRKAA